MTTVYGYHSNDAIVVLITTRQAIVGEDIHILY